MADETPKIHLTDKPDPTENVLKLVEAANIRQDDLREAETRRVNEQLVLRAYFDEKLREAEAKRIDAIRAVDVSAVAAASQRADNAASILATQVANTAETLRALVATTASANATTLSSITTTLTERLALLEKSQYEKAGGSVGMKEMWGYIFGVGMALVTLGLAVFSIFRH